jgi:hypothetical protein
LIVSDYYQPALIRLLTDGLFEVTEYEQAWGSGWPTERVSLPGQCDRAGGPCGSLDIFLQFLGIVEFFGELAVNGFVSRGTQVDGDVLQRSFSRSVIRPFAVSSPQIRPGVLAFSMPAILTPMASTISRSDGNSGIPPPAGLIEIPQTMFLRQPIWRRQGSSREFLA